MALKKIQKMFYYSNEYIKQFIESRIEDVSHKTQRSSSFIIENLLLSGLLPQNEDASHIIRTNLYPDDSQGGVKKTLDAIFSYNAAGTGWKSKHSNFELLVIYCINYCMGTTGYKGNDGDLYYLRSQLRDIVERIGNCTNACIEPYDRRMYSSQYELAKFLLKTAEDNPAEISFRNHFQLVYDCWYMLDDWSITYRYLSCLANLCDFTENSDARNELYDIISAISAEW